MKIGIIGCGKQAVKHISGYQRIERIDIVVADLDDARAKNLATEKGIIWKDLDSLFKDSEITVMDICTPTSTHSELIERSIASNCDFICEKPLCEDLKKTRELSLLVKSHGKIGMVGYIYRAAQVFRDGKIIVQDSINNDPSVLGKLTTAWFRIGGRGSHQPWKHMKETAGGAINEMLVHMIDLAIWYFGSVEHVKLLVDDTFLPERIINGKKYDVNTEDFVILELIMKNGLKVFCQADMITPAFNQSLEIQGTNGTFMASIQQDVPSYVYCINGAGKYKSGMNKLVIPDKNLYEILLSDFLSAVKARKYNMGHTIDDSIELMEVIESINKQRKV
jgi:predicted dehydrogenase